MSKQDEVREGQEAVNLLNNVLLRDAFEGVEQDYLEALLEVPVEDDISRFRFSEGIKVVRMVRQQLEVYVRNGQLSAHELDQMGTSKVRTH